LPKKSKDPEGDKTEKEAEQVVPEDNKTDRKTSTETETAPKQESNQEVKIEERKKTHGALPPPSYFTHTLEREKDEDKWGKNTEKMVAIENTINKIKQSTEDIKKRSKEKNPKEDEEFVRKSIQNLREFKGEKIEIQQADSARVDNIKIELKRKKGFEYPKGNKNQYVNEAQKVCRKAWKELKKYAQEHNVWQLAMEQEFITETERKHLDPDALNDTITALGHKLAVGILKGGIVYPFLAPWKFTELAMSLIFRATKGPYGFLDEKQARKMLEAFFGKKDEKVKTSEKKKDEKQDYEKEYETKKKIKDNEIKYRLKIKELLRPLTEAEIADIEQSPSYQNLKTNQEKKDYKEKIRRENFVKDLKKSSRYTSLTTDKEREDFVKEKIKENDEAKEANEEAWKDYRKSWFDMRKHWIKEGVWNVPTKEKEAEDEDIFLKEMGYDSEEYIRLRDKDKGIWSQIKQYRDQKKKASGEEVDHLGKEIKKLQKLAEVYLTDTEMNNINKEQVEKAKNKKFLKEAEKEKDNEDEINRLNDRIEESDKKVKDIYEKSDKRFRDKTWPPYNEDKGGGKKKGKKGQQSESIEIEDEEDSD